MANVLINEQYLTDIANAIREHSFSEDTYKPREMAAAIDALSFSVQEVIDGFLDGTYAKGIRSDVTTVRVHELTGMPITSLELPNATKLTGGLCQDCVHLARVDLPLLETVPGYMFEGCVGLTDVSVPSAEYIEGQAFKGCISLTNVDLSKCYRVEAGAFENCIKLRKIDLHNCSEVGTGAFKNCSVLSAVILRNPFMRASITDNSFPSSTWIYVPSALYSEYVDYAEMMPLPYTFKKIEDYPDICG